MILVVEPFSSNIASRALGWPVHVAFMTAQEGTGTGLAGGRGEGLGDGLGEGVGVGVATSEGVGVAITAVGAEPQPAIDRKTASAPTPSFTRD